MFKAKEIVLEATPVMLKWYFMPWMVFPAESLLCGVMQYLLIALDPKNEPILCLRVPKAASPKFT